MYSKRELEWVAGQGHTRANADMRVTPVCCKRYVALDCDADVCVRDARVPPL